MFQCAREMDTSVPLPIELTLFGGPPILEGVTLCFPEPAGPSLAAAAAAATCGEVGGELGDLLSDALGLADRFSGCAPSLSCKNQNSTVSPAVTTVAHWEREAPPQRDHTQNGGFNTQHTKLWAHAREWDGGRGACRSPYPSGLSQAKK